MPENIIILAKRFVETDSVYVITLSFFATDFMAVLFSVRDPLLLLDRSQMMTKYPSPRVTRVRLSSKLCFSNNRN